MGSDGSHEIDRGLAEISRLLTAQETVESTLAQICRTVVMLVDGADDAAVSLLEPRGKIRTYGATSHAIEQADQLQYETGEGPCMSSIENDAMFEIPDMEADEVWPTFSARAAAETGYRGLLANVLRVNEETLGALNVYSRRTDAFTDQDKGTGAIFAAQAAVVLANAQTHARDRQEISQLQEALASRDVIGRAKGILMAREDCTDEEAFEMLKQASQRLNVKLRDIAASVAGDTDPLDIKPPARG